MYIVHIYMFNHGTNQYILYNQYKYNAINSNIIVHYNMLFFCLLYVYEFYSIYVFMS